MKSTTTHTLTVAETYVDAGDLGLWLADKSGRVTVAIDHGDRIGESGSLRFTITEEEGR